MSQGSTHLRVAFSSFVGVLLLVLGGCATSSFTSFEGTISPTISPLVAQYSVRHYQPGFTVWVEFGSDTSYGRQTSLMSDSVTDSGGTVVTVLVAGMRPATTYHMRAHVDSPTGSWIDQDRTFTTGPLLGAQPNSPSSSPLFPSISAAQPTAGLTPSPGVELLSMTSPVQAMAVDLQGNVIWYCPGNAEPVKPLPNGHFIIVRGTDLQEVDLACNVIRDVSYTQVNESLQSNGYSFTIPPPLGVPGGNPFHHDVLVLPNGHWITLSQITRDFTDLSGHPGNTRLIGDAVIDIDANGNVAWAWSSFDHLDPNRHPYFALPDWTHSNALVYTADRNLLISMRNQSWILKLDYANGTGSGEILWKLGQQGDFTLGSDSSQWFYGQHYPIIVAGDPSIMTMAIYDDGNARIAADGTSCGTPPAAACYSRAALFQVDESTRLASVQWQYLPDFFSFWGGSIDVLPNRDVEFANSAPSNFTGSQIFEVTKSDTPQVVWQMNILGGPGVGAYRGYRIPSLYPGVVWQK
jgi:arylsulfate sulfotransferase